MILKLKGCGGGGPLNLGGHLFVSFHIFRRFSSFFDIFWSNEFGIMGPKNSPFSPMSLPWTGEKAEPPLAPACLPSTSAAPLLLETCWAKSVIHLMQGSNNVPWNQYVNATSPLQRPLLTTTTPTNMTSNESLRTRDIICK